MHYYQPAGTLLKEQRQPISNEQLLRMAPSAGAHHANKDTTSDIYSFIPTIEVIDALRDCGFSPVSARQPRSRAGTDAGFQKHEIRLRRTHEELRVGDSFIETIVTNAHDGTAGFAVSMGLFRPVCSNGLVVSDAALATVRCRHIGLTIDQVVQAAMSVIQDSDRIMGDVERYREIETTDEMLMSLLASGATARWGSVANSPFIVSKEFATPRRKEDRRIDLWTTMNVIQENLIQGGLRCAQVSDEHGHIRYAKVKAVTAIEAGRKINQALWETTRQLALPA